MAESSGADVFISYVEEDSAVALAIAEGLHAAGFSTWCYEVDSVPGVSYLIQTSRAIEQARAVIVLISPHSLGSHQVTKEVVRAHETEKPFIPVLISISHVEYGSRQPEWREAIGSATSISVPEGGVALILPRIIGGLEALGIKAGEGRKPATRAGAAATAPVPAAGDGARKKTFITAALVGVAVAVIATAALALGGGKNERAATGGKQGARDTRTDKTTATTDFGATTTAKEVINDASTSPVETSQGPARVAAARLTSQSCPPTGVPEPCRAAPGGTFFLIVDLVAWNEGEVLAYDSIYNEAFSSYVIFEGQKITTTENALLEDASGRQIPSGIRIIFALLPASATGSDIVLYWPSSTPVRIHPTS